MLNGTKENIGFATTCTVTRLSIEKYLTKINFKSLVMEIYPKKS